MCKVQDQSPTDTDRDKVKGRSEGRGHGEGRKRRWRGGIRSRSGWSRKQGCLSKDGEEGVEEEAWSCRE